MHDHILPPMKQALKALGGILDKAEAHCTAHNIDPEVLLKFRLFPDMFNFTKQVQLACDFAARLPPRLCGDELPSFPDTETSFAELKERIAKVIAYIEGYESGRFEGCETREIVLKLRSGEMKLDGLQFATRYALPQVYFHITTAYNILRHNGVIVGKRDYIGA
jgi:hypothetical protein